jgi:hypothetical protein
LKDAGVNEAYLTPLLILTIKNRLKKGDYGIKLVNRFLWRNGSRTDYQ